VSSGLIVHTPLHSLTIINDNELHNHNIHKKPAQQVQVKKKKTKTKTNTACPSLYFSMKLLDPYFPSLTHSSHSHKLLSPSFFNASNPLFLKRPRWPRMDAATTITTVHRCHRKNHNHHNKDKDKIVVIMGATGTGKSKLSIDLAALFKAEIINSDKMQVYKGLDITTNKIPPHERRGVTHHLLGELDPVPDLPPSEFRRLAGSVIPESFPEGNYRF
jgi:hypothetical protein